MVISSNLTSIKYWCWSHYRSSTRIGCWCSP